MLGWRRHRRAERERGAAAVEAALVTPLLFALLLGILEMSFLLRDHVAVSSAVRVGARVASAAADAGPGICESGLTAPPCTPQKSPAFAQAAADAIQRAGSAMPHDAINYLLVYKANSHGMPGAEAVTTMPASCAAVTNCVRFVWRPALNAFRYDSGAWDSKTVNACVNESDTLGVYMNANHDFLSGMFGASITTSDRAVMKFEPLPEDSCKTGRLTPHP
jgi:hypothetical protein